MPWQEVSTMSLREEFVQLAAVEGTNIRLLCRRFGVSPKTGYKWIQRYQQGGVEALRDQPRRPNHSPLTTPPHIEQLVIQQRERHPAWGGRKLHKRLANLYPHLMTELPHPSTITDILRRHGLLSSPLSPPHNSHKWHRFEHEAPNELWQMDFKGHFPLVKDRCHPLTVLDDHSRFSLGLRACPNEQEQTVQDQLVWIMRLYGLPARMTMDNGAPWGCGGVSRGLNGHTALTVWLMRLGIRISHSRPHHPQTQGKDERFHRTMQAELLHGRVFADLQECQRGFDRWREQYNLERPHQALGMLTPISRYRPSERPFPEQLPRFEYQEGDIVRKVAHNGTISYQARMWGLSTAFMGCHVALRPTEHDGVLDVYFCNSLLGKLNLHSSFSEGGLGQVEHHGAPPVLALPRCKLQD